MESDRFKNPFLHYGLMSLIVGTGLLTLGYHTIGHLLPRPPEALATCEKSPTQHEIVIQKDRLVPSYLEVRRCDTVSFINQSAAQHVIAFGTTQHHSAYPGFSSKSLFQGDKQEIIMSQKGQYLIHDYLRDDIKGTIIIK